jgi:hypothetical protein
MEVSMRSMLTAGVAALTASAIVVAPSVAPLPAPAPAAHSISVGLSAAVQPIVSLPSLTNIAAAAHGTQTVAVAAVNASWNGNAIMNFYFAVEPWVQYGFELATYAVGFVPIASFFSPLIMVAFSTGEPIVQSLFQSAQYLVDGNWTAIPNTLVNGFVQGGANLVNYTLNWIFGYLPPLPPIPPFAAPATAAAAAVAAPTLTPGFAKPLARASQAAPAPIETPVSDVAATAKTVVDTGVADIAGVATPAQTAAPEADTAVVDPTPTAIAVTPDTDVTPPHPTVSEAAKAPGLATAAVSGVKKAFKSVTKAGKAARSEKSSGSAAGGE